MKNEKIENIIEIAKHIILQFFVIYGCIMILMTIVRSSMGLEPATYEYLFYVMAFSVLGALPGLILMVHTDVSEKAMKIRWILHFIVLESLIITAAIIVDIVTEPAAAVVLFLEVAAIYMIVRLLDWENDKKTSDKINEGLRKRKEK